MTRSSDDAAAQVDAYIARAPAFARPILEVVRSRFHKVSPEIREAVKWRSPHFVRRGILGGMAAFQRHVRIVFWNGALLDDPEGRLRKTGTSRMATLRVASVDELPPERLMARWIRQALRLDEPGAIPPRFRSKAPRRPLEVPGDLQRALCRNRRAWETFRSFSESHRREYVEWVTEAKREQTRARRIATAVEWMAEGKPRNWKYMRSRR